MNEIKKFFKELKRTRWAKSSEVKKSFILVLLFIIVFALILFGLAFGLAAMWEALGVGVYES